jgi:hypothetical protein
MKLHVITATVVAWTVAAAAVVCTAVPALP